MSHFRLLTTALALLLAPAAPLAAQVVVSLRLDRNQYVAGEAVPAQLSITNHAGRDLVFQDTGRVPWLDFIIKDERGGPVTPIGRPAFGAVKVPRGQAMSRSVDLAHLFRLSQMGNYSIYAVVRLPGQESEGFLSNRILFTMTTAHAVWTQKVGVAGRPGQTREFRVLTYSGDQKTALYVQITDTRSGTALKTFALGEALMFRKPLSTLDGKQCLHVLYLATPSVWCHSIVDPNGRLLSQTLHKRGPDGDPALATLPDGQVQVAGAIPYDPKAEREALSTTRKLSERPSFIYE
jgi:hypothetical protein